MTAEKAPVNLAESAALLAAFFCGAAFLFVSHSRAEVPPPQPAQPSPEHWPVIGPPGGWKP